MMVPQAVKDIVGNIDWINAVNKLGFPIVMALGFGFAGWHFADRYLENQEQVQAAQADALLQQQRAVAEATRKDGETKQTLLERLIGAQITQGEMTASTLIRMGDAVAEMKRISETSARNDLVVISNQDKIISLQGRAIDNHGKIITAIQTDVNGGKELLGVNKKILEAIQQSAPRSPPAPAPKAGGTSNAKPSNKTT
jgi:hypothetical protein